MKRDLMNNVHVLTAIAPVVVADNTAQVGLIIDTQGFTGVMFAIALGTLVDADATFTTLVEDGNASNLSDASPVADRELNGTELLASFNFANDLKARKIGYRGIKRYVRLTITPAGNTGAAPLSAMAILAGEGSTRPYANPPA